MMGWAAFLQPLVHSVEFPPSEHDFLQRVIEIGRTLDDIPAAMLTPALQREAKLRFRRWPSIAELGEWLRPIAAEERRRNAACDDEAERTDELWFTFGQRRLREIRTAWERDRLLSLVRRYSPAAEAKLRGMVA